MLFHYLKIAFRNLWKHKMQSIFNILGLAVGFACFVFWMTASYVALPDDFPEAERSFTVGHSQNPYCKEISYRFVNDLLRQFPQIEQFTWFTYPSLEYLSTSDGDASPKYNANVMAVSPDYFRFFSVAPVAGNIPAGKEQGLVIDNKYAKKMFGDESPLGRTIYINHEAWIILGVIHSQGLYQSADFYRLNDPGSTRGNVRLMVKLYENASILDFTEKIGKVKSTKPDGSTDFLRAESMKITAKMVVTVVIIKLLVLLIGSLLLIVALFNYISYTLSRFYRRTKECGIRKVNGCNTLNLFLLFFTEVFISMVLAGIISFQLCNFMVNVFNETNPYYQLEYNKAAGNFIFYFSWSVVLALLLCLPVVGRIERMGLLSTITSKPTTRKRLFFIGAQMFISIALVIFSSWMLLQINHFFSSAYPGLSRQEKREIVMMNPEILQVIDRDLPDRVVREVLSNADVIAVTRFNSYSRFVLQPSDNTQKIEANVFHIDDQYAAFFKVRMLEGRFPQTGETGVATIDRKLSEILGSENPVGQTIEIQVGNNNLQVYTICGVCERIPEHSGDINPSCYISGEKDLLQAVYLKINPNNFEDALAGIRRQTNEYSMSIPAFTVKTLEEAILENGLASIGKIAVILTGIALLLSMFGVYSSVSIETESRRREVAIRKINGAEGWDIFLLFGKSYFIVLVIAWLLASFVMKPVISLMSMDFEVTIRYNLRYYFFLIILAVMVLITISTIFNKVRSISKINPAEEIKSE